MFEKRNDKKFLKIIVFYKKIGNPGYGLNYPGLELKDFPGIFGSGSNQEASLSKIIPSQKHCYPNKIIFVLR